MRYLCFPRVLLAAILSAAPLYALGKCKDSSIDRANECAAPEKEAQDYSTCDTYVTNSRSSVTLQSAEHRITERVKELLEKECDLPDISVTTANGIVILSGTAINQDQIDKAVGLVYTVPCVTEVDTSKFYVQ